MKVEKLKTQFDGVGETKGLIFVQITRTKNTALFCCIGEKSEHFEVFTIKCTPKCLDFEKRLYSESEFKESYPKANDFGKTAWTYRSFERAIEKYNDISLDVIG